MQYSNYLCRIFDTIVIKIVENDYITKLITKWDYCWQNLFKTHS